MIILYIIIAIYIQLYNIALLFINRIWFWICNQIKDFEFVYNEINYLKSIIFCELWLSVFSFSILVIKFIMCTIPIVTICLRDVK